MAIRTWLGKEAACNPPPARRTPSDRVVPVSCWHGVYFPTGYTVAVVDDVEETRACVRELVDVGVPPADVQLATADKAIEMHRRQRGGARLHDRIIGALPTDERSIQAEYLMQADDGSQFVVFRSHGKDQVLCALEHAPQNTQPAVAGGVPKVPFREAPTRVQNVTPRTGRGAQNGASALVGHAARDAPVDRYRAAPGQKAAHTGQGPGVGPW
jgi:hypothetical protein